MGRKTLESLPGGKPLVNRENIVISREVTPERVEEYLAKDVALYTLDNFIDMYKQLLERGEELDDIFIIGGGEIYNQFMNSGLVNEVYVTLMYDRFEADTSFPNLDEDIHWEVSMSSNIHEENGVKFRYLIYKKTA